MKDAHSFVKRVLKSGSLSKEVLNGVMGCLSCLVFRLNDTGA
uniref:Uncharacterized protein n=1 Tax=Anguilla anguilla TaxID=7936 RepID=A0A0E9TWL0_ANGAN